MKLKSGDLIYSKCKRVHMLCHLSIYYSTVALNKICISLKLMDIILWHDDFIFQDNCLIVVKILVFVSL